MKVLAIASAGGHWIQLQRLLPAFDDQELIFMSTKKSFADTVDGHKFYYVPDANRWEKAKLLRSAFSIFFMVLLIRPKVIITTGAAPGLMAIVAGKLLGAKTIWIDSIANVEALSMSGRIASKIAHRVYTQWEHLVTEKVFYHGNILS